MTRRWATGMVLGAVMALAALAGCSGSGEQGAAGDTDSAAVAPQEAPQRDGALAESAPDAADEARPDAGRERPANLSVQRRDVVRTADIDIEVARVDRAVPRVRAVGPQFGGFVADEQTGSDTATFTLRVASDRLNPALDVLGELGEVNSRSVSSQDVTEEVIDLRARIDNQRASVARMRALLAEADSIGDVVQVEAELTARQAELESLEQRSAALADQVALSTVTVSLAEARDAEPAAAAGGFLPGLSAGIRALGATAVVALTGVGAVLPFVVVLLVPVGIWWFVRRRRRPVPQLPSAPATSGQT